MNKNDFYLEPVTDTNFDEWDRFLLAQEYQNPFQSGALLNILKGIKFYEPNGIIARDRKSGCIIGGFVVYRIIEKGGIFAKYATRSIVNGGPIVQHGYEEAIFPALLNEIIAISGKDSVYTEIWNMCDQKGKDRYYEQDFQYLPWLNYFIKLDIEPGIMFDNLSDTTRKHIKRASKKIDIINVANDVNFNDFYDCLHCAYKRMGIPLLHRDVFKKIYESGLGLFLLALYENKPIASRIALIFGKEIYDWYAGSDPKHKGLFPNELLVWHILKYGSENNYCWFNFGGAGQPDAYYGPREFKRRFGGNLVEYGRYRRINSYGKYFITRIGLKIYNIIYRYKRTG